jgi:mRNA (guanine-N7-)-methyltransferase
MKQGAQVLDLACGRGGDLKKFRENKAGSYYGLDAVPERIEEARERHRSAKCMFAAVFEVGDFTKVGILSFRIGFHDKFIASYDSQQC